MNRDAAAILGITALAGLGCGVVVYAIAWYQIKKRFGIEVAVPKRILWLTLLSTFLLLFLLK